MSYLSTALTRLAEQQPISQSEIARGSGLSRGFISRLFSGESTDLSDKNFVALLLNFASNKNAQSQLVAARCMDARVGPGAEHVEIAVTNHETKSAKQTSEFPIVELSHETERAFTWLRSQCPLNPDLEKHLVGYAKLTGMR